MLVLTRKPGESILIGDDIEVMIGDFGETKVKIAIKAPEAVSIKRGEMVRRDDDDESKNDRGRQPERSGSNGTERARPARSRRFAAAGSAKGRRRVVINPAQETETPSDGERASA